MSKSVFSDKPLAKLYEYFDVEKEEDSAFVDLFNSLSDWLIAIDDNRSKIDTVIIRSTKMQNYTLINKEEKRFTLVWDTSFWYYYVQFLLVFFSYDSLMDCDIYDIKLEKWLSDTESFFCSRILDCFSERFSRCDEIKGLCSRFKKWFSNTNGVVTLNGTKETIDSIVLISKEFVIMHEFEHILYHLSPEIFNKDTKTFDDVLRYYCDVIIDEIDESITHIKSDDYKAIVKDVLINKDKPSYSELYGDFHAFFEVLIHHNENFNNTNQPFTQNASDYLYALKLLKVFESCINSTTETIDSWLSTEFQDKKYREKKVEETSIAYQKKVYNRDYLSVELVSISLILCAQEFCLDSKEFAASIDTSRFMLPYTEKIQPLLNRLMQILMTCLIREN